MIYATHLQSSRRNNILSKAANLSNQKLAAFRDQFIPYDVVP